MEDQARSVEPISPEGRAELDNSELYVGTKIVKGEPMDEWDFLKDVKGKSIEDIRQQETQGAGYKVTYGDGYISWSPKRVFEQCYRLLSNQEIKMAKQVEL